MYVHMAESHNTFLWGLLQLRVIIPREEQGIKEFDDKEFLTRKTDKENKEFTRPT